MEKTKVIAIAQEKGIKDIDLFVSFICGRFPDEMSINYVEEWADRFRTDDPQGYMDSDSKKIYNELQSQNP